MVSSRERDDFFHTLRAALGRVQASKPRPSDVSAFLTDAPSAGERARAIIDGAEANAGELMSSLEQSALEAGWKVFRAASAEEAGRYVGGLAKDLEARKIVRSAHPVLDTLGLESIVFAAGVEVRLMAADEGVDRPELRRHAIEADLGVTGVDYCVAETGSCVLLSRQGASRLPSLLPPAHVAVVQKGQVLPGLDELFALRRAEALRGEPQGYMNIISGPSRSADIEYTLVTGVHGPGEVHMVLLG